jgi:SAM-dependent methyltransferase
VTTRWKEAQARESVAWQRMEVAAPTYLERRAARIGAWLRFHGASSVLEIGGAGLPSGDFHAIDPLMRQFRLARGVAGRGEALPYRDRTFDAVLMLNVIDHVEDPPRCLAEAARVLRPKGVLLLSCNVYARTWLLLRSARVRLLGQRNNDILHPHHFTARSLRALFARRFEILEASLSHADPLAGERPFRPRANPLKGEARLYLVGRPC